MNEKLVRLLGFIIRIYHDAQSSECQIINACWSYNHRKELLYLQGQKLISGTLR